MRRPHRYERQAVRAGEDDVERMVEADVRGAVRDQLGRIGSCRRDNEGDVEPLRFEEPLRLAGDHVRVVVWRNQREAAFASEPASNGFAVVAFAIVQEDVGAVAFGGGGSFVTITSNFISWNAS